MSRQGLADVRGSTVNVWRPTMGKTSAGASGRTWPAVPNTVGVKVWLEALTAEMAHRVFGDQRRCTVRASVPIGVDVQEKDGLEVTAGRLLGRRYQVVSVVPYDHLRRADHQEVGLLETTEAFTT